MQNKLTLDEIILTNKKTVLETQAILNLAIAINDDGFIKAIKEQNLEKAAKCNEWGLSWEKQQFWTQLSNVISNINPTSDTIDFLMSLTPEEMVHKTDSYKAFNYNVFLDSKKNLTRMLEICFANKLEYGDFNIDLFAWTIKNKPEIFNVKSFIIHSMRKFGTVENISDEKHNQIHEFITKNHAYILPAVFQQTAKTGNMDFFITSPYYKEHFQEFLTAARHEDIRTNIMQEAITIGNVDSIKFWHEQGIPLPSHHHPYTALFSTDKKLPAMKYVLNHMEDITMHRQCILKCALHHDIDGIIPDILIKYTKEQKEDLHLTIANRPKTKAVVVVQNYITDNGLEPKSLDNSITTHTKMKM